MKNIIISTALFLALSSPSFAKDKPAEQHTPSWGYTGSAAAAHWGNLDENYTLCKNGLAQSPVNIARYLQEDISPISTAYTSGPFNVINSGHTVEIAFKGGSRLNIDDKTYSLLQAHFHTPSEHYLDGAPYPMEAHLVHKAKDGTLAVIGIMMKIGAQNPTIEKIWQNVPASGETQTVKNAEISAAELLPTNLDYYKYEGSLTTPPCSEGVQWHVLKTPIEISEKQLRAFQSVFPVNARPIQSLNTRIISGN